MAENEQQQNGSNLAMNSNIRVNTQNKPAQENNKIPVHVVFFYNIRYDTKPDVVRKFAEKFGEIKSIFDRQDAGQYFVTYYDIRDAKRAVEQAPFQEIEGREVKANYAFKNDKNKKDPVCATIQFTTSSSQITESDIHAKLSEFGEIRQIRKDGDNVFVVKYFNLRSVNKALENPEVEIMGEKVTLEARIGEDDGISREPDAIKKSDKRRDEKDFHKRDDRNNNNKPRNERTQQPQVQQTQQYQAQPQYQNYPPQQPYYPPQYPPQQAAPPPYPYNYPYPPQPAQQYQYPQNHYSYPPPPPHQQQPYPYQPPPPPAYPYPQAQHQQPPYQPQHYAQQPTYQPQETHTQPSYRQEQPRQTPSPPQSQQIQQTPPPAPATQQQQQQTQEKPQQSSISKLLTLLQ